MAAAALPPALLAAVGAVAVAERGATAAWEALVPVALASFPTRAAVEAARTQLEAALALSFLNERERELFALRGQRALHADVQKAKTRTLAKVRDCWRNLVDKWLFPESATTAVNGTFWARNLLGHGVHAVERALPQAAVQEAPARAGVRRERAPSTSVLERIKAYGVQTPPELFALHDRGPTTTGCGGWRQMRAIYAAPASFGKSFFAKHLIGERMREMAADPRGTGPFLDENIGVFSATGAGWEELPQDQVRLYDAELVRDIFEQSESAALAAKAEGEIPVPRLFIFDDVAGLRGVDRDPIIDRLFTQGRNLNFSVFLIGQSPRNLINPTRKTNASFYFFGKFMDPSYSNDFARMASARLPDYSSWARSNLGHRHGYVFGCVLEEAVEAAEEEELPFILAAASLPEPADAEHDEPAEAEPADAEHAERAEYDDAAEHHAEHHAEPEPESAERPANAGAGRAEPAVSDARAIADVRLADGRVGREMIEGERAVYAAEELDDDGDGIDYDAEERRLANVGALLLPPSASASASASGAPGRHTFGFYANAASRPAGSQDLYETPRNAVLHVFPLIPAGVKTIWECCYGNGAIYNVLAEAKDEHGDARYRLLGTDFFTEAPDGKGDFLTMEPPAPYDMIITNPPYNNKVEWVKKLVATEKPWLILFPLTAMAGVGLSALWATIGAKFFILTHTPRFLHAGRVINIGECVWVAGNGAAAAFPTLNWLPAVPASL